MNSIRLFVLLTQLQYCAKTNRNAYFCAGNPLYTGQQNYRFRIAYSQRNKAEKIAKEIEAIIQLKKQLKQQASKLIEKSL